MTNDTKSLAYFLGQLGQFFNIMGLETFWASEDQKRAAKTSIGHLYLRLQMREGLSAADRESAEIAFVAAMDEFTRRELLVLLHPYVLQGAM